MSYSTGSPRKRRLDAIEEQIGSLVEENNRLVLQRAELHWESSKDGKRDDARARQISAMDAAIKRVQEKHSQKEKEWDELNEKLYFSKA